MDTNLSEEEQAALKKTKDEAKERASEFLLTTWPKCFIKDKREMIPLEQHVHLKVLEFFDELNSRENAPDLGFRKGHLRHALTRYIIDIYYHKAAVKLKYRINLNGERITDLTEDEIKYHQNEITRIEEIIKAKSPKKFNNKFKKPMRKNFKSDFKGNNKGDAKGNFKTGERKFGTKKVFNKAKPALDASLYPIDSKIKINLLNEVQEVTIKSIVEDKLRVQLSNGLIFSVNADKIIK